MTNKTSSKPKEVEVELEPVSAVEEHEAEITIDELLADMPPLRAPHRLRLRHRNAIRSIGFRYQDKLAALGITQNEDGESEITSEQAMLMLDIAAEVDEWAESLAEDPAAYETWAEANSDNPEKFIALMSRYQESVGESNGSTS